MMSDSLLCSSFFSRGVSVTFNRANRWPRFFLIMGQCVSVCLFPLGKVIQRRNWKLGSTYLSTSYMGVLSPGSIATRITHCVVIHFQNCHTTFSNHSKVNSLITYSLLYISFPSLIGKKSSQSAALDITQHARIDHKRQQREKFKTKI